MPGSAFSNAWKLGLVAVLFAFRACAEDAVNFEENVKPILKSQCNQCHNPDKAKGGLDMSTLSALLRGSSSGAIVAPGDPDGSSLFLSMAHKHEPFMPKDGDMRPAAELEVVKKWIAGGLIERRGGTARAVEKSKLDFVVPSLAGVKPEGPPPMPLESYGAPVFVSDKANAVRAMAASPWAPLVAIGGESQIVLYNSETSDLLATIPFPEGEPKVLRFSRNGKLLLCGGGVGGQSGRVVLWDVTNGRRVAEVGDEYDAVLAADVRADQKMIALGGPARVVRVFNTKDGEKAYEIRKHTDWVTAMEFSPDGILLATGDRNGGLFLWEAAGGQSYFDLAGHQGAITKISWRSDGNVVASASEDGTVKLWNAQDGKLIKSIVAHEGGVSSVEFSRDGKLVTCGRDKLVKVWTADGKETKTITGFADIVTAAVFSHNAARIITGDWAGSVKVFATADGGQCGKLRANPPSLASQILDAMAAREPAQKRYDELKGLADTANGAVNEQTKQLADARNDAAAKAANVQAAEGALAAAKKDLDGATAELASAKTELANRDADLAARRERARLASEREANARTAHEGLQRQLGEESKLVDEMAKVLASARAAQFPTKNDAAVLNAADNAEKKGKEAADTVATLNRKLPESAGELDKIALLAKEANSVIKAGMDAVADAKSAVEQKQNATNGASGRKDDADKALSAAKGAKDNADKTVADKQAKVAEVQTAANVANETAAAAKQDLKNTDKRSDRLKAEQFDALAKRAEDKLGAKGNGPFTLNQIVDATQKAVEDIPPFVPPATNTTKKVASADDEKPERTATPHALLFLGRFHMVILHLPIGALLLALILELDHLIRRTERNTHFITQCLRFGAAFAVVTAILGYLLSLDPIYDPAELSRHKWTGIWAAAVSVIAAVLRHRPQRIAIAGYWVALIATAGLLSIAGHEGGMITHGSDFLSKYFPDFVASFRGKAAAANPEAESVFIEDIHPILDANCISCHGPQKHKGGLRLDIKAKAIAGGESKKKGIVPGNALKSEIVRRLLLSRSDDDVMPPSNKSPLKPAEIIAIVQWINDGAAWPEQTAPVKAATAPLPKGPPVRVATPKATNAPLPAKAASPKP